MLEMRLEELILNTKKSFTDDMWHNFSKIRSNVDKDTLSPQDAYKIILEFYKIEFSYDNIYKNIEELSDDLQKTVMIYSCISTLIHNHYMNMWKTDTNTLYKLAKENTPCLLPFVFNTMSEIITRYFSQNKENKENDFEDQHRDSLLSPRTYSPLYVLTNAKEVHGAAAILYDGVLSGISETLGKDLIIIPSSIHEVLLIPYEDTVSCIELSEMVKSINATELSIEEVLSDNIYLYKRETNMVSAAFKESELSKTADTP